MKTSVIEVHDMLSVFSVDEVEKRIGDVPGVQSVTVNHAAGGATVRYDETRIEIGDIKSVVRQRGYDSPAPAAGLAGDGHEGHAPAHEGHAPAAAAPKPPAGAAAKPTADTPPAPPEHAAPKAPAAAAPKHPADAPANADPASADTAKEDKAAPDAAPSATDAGSKKLK